MWNSLIKCSMWTKWGCVNGGSILWKKKKSKCIFMMMRNTEMVVYLVVNKSNFVSIFYVSKQWSKDIWDREPESMSIYFAILHQNFFSFLMTFSKQKQITILSMLVIFELFSFTPSAYTIQYNVRYKHTYALSTLL